MGLRLVRLPLFVLLLGVFSLAALVPSVHALILDDHRTSRVFFYGMILGSSLAAMLAVILMANERPREIRHQLRALTVSYVALPVLLAVPFYAALDKTSFLNAWFEMISCLTTTGALLHDNVGQLNPSLHLWRAIVAWLGGLMLWIAAFAILSPLQIGGFEVRAASGVSGPTRDQPIRNIDPAERMLRFIMSLTPVYAGLTALLWIALLVAGEEPIVAITHAMGTLSTSGVSVIGGPPYGASGVMGEVLMVGFLVFALSRGTFAAHLLPARERGLSSDVELRLAGLIVALTTGFLFLRHFVGAEAVLSDLNLREALPALWGTFFTVISFLTTTGYESFHWVGAAEWSGLDAPGVVLIGLVLIGGGAATTAGGVKLLRVYALFRHGQREAEKLVHPNSVGGAGTQARQIRRQGAQIAWLFLMLFTVLNFLFLGLLTLTGVQFDTALVLTASALSNTGPLADLAMQNPIPFSGLPDLAKLFLGAAMILGRLEVLALIAVFNPELWRD